MLVGASLRKEIGAVNTIREGGRKSRHFPTVFPLESFISRSVSRSVGEAQANPIYGRKRQNEVNELHAEWRRLGHGRTFCSRLNHARYRSVGLELKLITFRTSFSGLGYWHMARQNSGFLNWQINLILERWS